MECVLAVAPGAAEIASGEADEDARQTGVGGFALKRFVDLSYLHLASGWRTLLRIFCGGCIGFEHSDVFDVDAAVGDFLQARVRLVVKIFRKILG